MAVIVSDTSPLRALQHLGLIDLLPALYGDVFVPPAVRRELDNPPPGLPVVNVSSIPFIRIQSPQDQKQLKQLLIFLDEGEAEVLTLALDIQVQSVLMDEKVGRAAAQRLGLVPFGALGTLVRAKQKGHIAEVKPLMDRLEKEIRFFISPKLRAETLRLAGE